MPSLSCSGVTTDSDTWERAPKVPTCRELQGHWKTSFPVVGKRAQLLHLCSGNAAVIVPRGASMYTVFGTWGGSVSTGIVIASLCVGVIGILPSAI